MQNRWYRNASWLADQRANHRRASSRARSTRRADEHRPTLVIAVGGRSVKAALRRTPELRDETILRASQIARWRWNDGR
jgi:hypothetical protein